MAKRFSSGPPSAANTGAGGGVYRSRYYGPGGGYFYAQNQPGVSDFGQDAGGRYTSTNINASPPTPAPVNRRGNRAQNDNQDETGYAVPQMMQQYVKMLQQQYPQYTNHAHFQDKSLPKGIAGLGGQGTWQADSKQIGNDPTFARFVLLKELGQANMDRMIPNKSTGDSLMNLWGAPGQHFAYDNWTPQTDFAHLPNAIDIGGYKTFPTDAYGIQFAAALNHYLPGIAPGTHNLLSGPMLAYAQSRGMVPTPYSRPTTPQQPQPNVSDLGRGINNVRAPTQYPAVLPAQVNNPALPAMQQRAAQQNSANLAMRGGPRNF